MLSSHMIKRVEDEDIYLNYLVHKANHSPKDFEIPNNYIVRWKAKCQIFDLRMS